MENSPPGLNIENSSRDEFKRELLKIEKGEYVVETLADGRQIRIKKPGKKGENDFLVQIYDPKNQGSRCITHEEIKKDIKSKKNKSPKKTAEIVKALLRVCEGEDPKTVLNNGSSPN